MNSDEFAISLRIRGGSFSSQKVSKALGLRPWIVRAADRREIVDVESDEPATYWSHKFSFVPELRLEQAIALVADNVSQHASTFHELRENGCSIELFVGLTFQKSSGHELDWKVLSKLAGARVGLSLDLYCTPKK